MEPASRAWASYYALQHLLTELGLQENDAKAEPLAQRQVCLGVLFDTINTTMSVTNERLSEIRELLASWMEKTVATKRDLQSLV